MMDFNTFLDILKRRAWLVLLLPALMILFVWVFDSYRSPVYRSNIRLLIYADNVLLEGRDLIYGYYSLDQASIVDTFVELANSRRIVDETALEMGIGGAQRDSLMINTIALPNTSVLELSARSSNPAMAQQAANIAGERITEMVAQYYDGYKIEILDPAFLPLAPIEPNPKRDSGVALALGLVMGSGLAFLEYFWRQGIGRSKRGRDVDVSSSAYSRSFLERQLSDSIDIKNQEGCLAIIRLNGLKSVEGRMSRQLYDRLLQHVVNLMAGELRGKDVIARWNDVSFAVFMPNVASAEAVRLLEGVQAVLEQPQRFPDSGPWIYYDPHIGAVTTGSSRQLSTMIQEAEAALVKAGMNGSKPVMATTQFREIRELR